MDDISPQLLRYTNRWFAYFDLLGFSNLVRLHRIDKVVPIYNDVLNIITEKAEPKRGQGISYSWFSDTFIIFSRTDSDEDFALIEHVSRLFFQKLILNCIPVRGSLTVGPLYTHLKKNIFIGEALIDAYEYGEKQNWLGFVLTPKVYRHLENGNLHLERRAHYRRVTPPEIITHQNRQNVFAFAFNNGLVNGKNPYLEALSTMMLQCPAPHRQKYQNTITFIENHVQQDLRPQAYAKS